MAAESVHSGFPLQTLDSHIDPSDMSVGRVTGLAQQVLADAPPPNQELLAACVKSAHYKMFLKPTQHIPNSQEDVVLLDQALQVVNEVIARYPHFKGANRMLVMIHHLMNSVEEVIHLAQQREHSKIEGIRKQRPLNIMLGIMLEQGLNIFSLYVRKEVEALDPVSISHRVTMQNIAHAEELYENLKCEVLANFRKDSRLSPLFQAFEAAILLFEKDPKALMANVVAEKECTTEEKLQRVREQFALIRKTIQGLQKYCPFNDLSNWTPEFREAYQKTLETWIGSYPALEQLLSQISPSAEPHQWFKFFKSLQTIYQPFFLAEHISPIHSTCLRYANQGHGFTFQGVFLGGGFVTLYGISSGLISTLLVGITDGLSLIIEQMFSNTDWTSLLEPLSIFRTVESQHRELLGSELIRGLLTEIDLDLLSEAPCYSIADHLKKEFDKKIGGPSQAFLQMRQQMDKLQGLLSLGGAPSGELAVSLASALQRCYEQRRGFQIDLALLTTDIEQLASMRNHPDQSTISPIAREACLGICIRLAYSITFSVRVCSYLIEMIEGTITGSMEGASLEGSVGELPAVKTKKKRKKKKVSASVVQQPTITISKKANSPEPSSPLERTLSDGMAALMSLPIDEEESSSSLPNRMQVISICQDLQMRHPEASSYLKNVEVFLEVCVEQSVASSTLYRHIDAIDATRKAFEFVLLGLLSIYLPHRQQPKTHDLDHLAHPLFNSRTPRNVQATLIEAWDYIERLAQANEAVHYPLTSQFRNPWLVTRLSEARKIGLEITKSDELRQVTEKGWAFIQALLEGVNSPHDRVGPLQIPLLQGRLDEGPTEPDPEVLSTMEELPGSLSIFSPPLAQSTIDQIQAWISFILKIPVIGDRSVPECTDLRNRWLEQAQMYCKQLQELLREPKESWGYHTVLGELDWTRRLVKAMIAAVLYHHGESGFNERQNNPRRLAERLPEEIRVAIGVPPASLSYAQEASARPVRTPFSRGAGPLQSVVEPIPSLLKVSQTMRENPGQHGYQIGGEIVTPGQHQSRMMALIRQALHMTIHPSLSYTMTVLEQGFMPK